MDFKPTSINARKKRSATGLTLVELMVAMAVGLIVLAVIASLTLWSSRSFAAMANYAELDNASRNALDTMTREVRQVQGLISYTTNSTVKELALLDTDGQPLYYRYKIPQQQLVRVKGGRSETLLEDCITLDFKLYQRNNVSNTFDQYQVFTGGTNASLTCKVIQVDWICSRKLLPTEQINSESIQTAKIVIRHK
jgi:Tfp pilus assembly protein PilW